MLALIITKLLGMKVIYDQRMQSHLVVRWLDLQDLAQVLAMTCIWAHTQGLEASRLPVLALTLHVALWHHLPMAVKVTCNWHTCLTS
jgi:hypothetical protein